MTLPSPFGNAQPRGGAAVGPMRPVPPGLLGLPGSEDALLWKSAGKRSACVVREMMGPPRRCRRRRAP
eukprot:5315170-Alexandrium_andersonii.AAC.1